MIQPDPAFPVQGWDNPGLDKREYFAAAALTGLLANCDATAEKSLKGIAALAWEMGCMLDDARRAAIAKEGPSE